MASTLIKKAILSNSSYIRKTTVFCNAVRNHWNYQYKPGPYPKTPEERAAAAKKYGMTIDEYKPFPEDHGYGDYPMLSDIGAESKDNYYPYDAPHLKRNFNEPIHALAEIYGEDRYDVSFRPRYSKLVMLLWFAGTLTGCFTLYFVLDDYKIGRPVTCKQMPECGPHYYFTPK